MVGRTRCKMVINSDQLELVDNGTLAACRQAYNDAQAQGGGAFFDAQVQLAYALAHSDREENVATAQRLGREMLSEMGDRRDEAWRHVLFINAVADYRLGHYSAAKEKLRTLVLSPQGHRQAQRLLDEVEDRIVKEGLIGVGVVGAGVVALGLLGAALFGGRSSRG